jgi:hypothetical protein
MKLFLLIATLLWQAAAPTGSVTGKVTVAGSALPLPEAEIAIATPAGVLETTTGADGSFSLTNVPAGRYTVIIRADGYFAASAANAVPQQRVEVPVTVAQQPANVLVEMVRGAIITGKILDPQGRPLIRAEVHALRPDGVQRVAVRQTNDEGEYRMFWVPPGEFVIRVNPVVVPANLASVSPGPMISVPTFFPGTPDVAQATKISVKSGDEIRNINFAARTDVVLRPTPPPPGSPLAAAAAAGPGVKVSGQIMNALMPATGMAALVIGSEADPAQPRQVGQVNVNAATVPFEIPSVPPGKYDLLVRMNDPRGSLGTGGATQAWGRTTLEVRDRDIDGVRLTIHASFDVPGTITIDGKPPMDGGNLKVGLVPMGTVSRIANYRGITNRDQTPGDGGKFAIQSAAEGNYEVVVKGLPVGGYIADVRQGDTSVLADGVSVRDVPPAAFQVLVSTDGGSV